MVQTMRRLVVCACAVLMLASCAARESQAPPPSASAPAPAVAVPIPPGCPLARIQPGMRIREVMDLIGRPTDVSGYVTGKAFIPFYAGDDATRRILYYKGMGRVIMSGGGISGPGQVLDVEYDPNEPGYVR